MCDTKYIDVMFKTPDAVQTAIDRMGLSEEDDAEQRDLVERHCKKWVQYGEYVKIRIHLDTGEAEVLPAN